MRCSRRITDVFPIQTSPYPNQLVEIQERNKDNADVFALLWQIERLRALVLQADQLQRSLCDVEGGACAVLELLRSQLKDEPWGKEFPKHNTEK